MDAVPAPAGALPFWLHRRRQPPPLATLSREGMKGNENWTLGDFRACSLEAHTVKMSHSLILPSPVSTVSQHRKGSIAAQRLAQEGRELPLVVSLPPWPSLGILTLLNMSLLLHATAQVSTDFYFIV